MPKKQIDKRGLRKIIRKLLEQGPLSQNELVGGLTERYGLDKTSVDRSVEKLVKSGRIQRVPHVGLRLKAKKLIRNVGRRPAKPSWCLGIMKEGDGAENSKHWVRSGLGKTVCEGSRNNPLGKQANLERN